MRARFGLESCCAAAFPGANPVSAESPLLVALPAPPYRGGGPSVSRSLGHRAPLLWITLPFVGGLALARVGDASHCAILLIASLTGALLAFIAAFRRRRLWGPTLAIAMVLAGGASYTIHLSRLDRRDDVPPREIRATIGITRLLAGSNERRMSGFAEITATENRHPRLIGQRVFFSWWAHPGTPIPRRGARLAAICVLTPVPHDPQPDSFDAYVANQGVNFTLTHVRFVRIVTPQPAYYRFCDTAAAKLGRILGAGIDSKRHDLAGLLRAMMLGKTRELTGGQHSLFMQSGTMHLFAISGLHIGVISGAILALFSLVRLPFAWRFATGTILLWLFVDITGGSPSAIRAFAMAVFVQAAFAFRRPANPLAAIVASAAVVLMAMPFQLFSASFQMSYGIVLALLLLGLPLGESWMARWSPWRSLPKPTWAGWQRWIAAAWRYFATTLAIGTATTLVSMIASVRYFHVLTPGALLANLVVIPTAVIVILGGLASILCGLFGFAAGAALFNHAAALVLLVIENLLRIGVRIPGAFFPAHFRAAWIGSAALTGLLGAIFFGYANGWRRNRGGWWPPFLITAAALVFGVKLG